MTDCIGIKVILGKTSLQEITYDYRLFFAVLESMIQSENYRNHGKLRRTFLVSFIV